jgi:peptidoglycan DL-endopeptidase CwlO
MRFRLPLHLVVLVLLLVFPAGVAAAPDPSSAAPLAIGKTLLAPRETPAERRGRKAVEIALRYRGTPYVWAGSTPAGFDCSGFVMYVYGKVGVSLPHNGAMQWARGRAVLRRNLEPGDVVFFNGLGHVGIYVGRGRFIHSPHTGDVVKISGLSEGWYSSSYVGARRY